MKALAEAIRIMSHKQLSKLEKEGELQIELDGKTFLLNREDVDIVHEDIEGWLVAADDAHRIMVALDTEITEELEMMGLARELVSRVQTLRKESGLDITDRIMLRIEGSDKLLQAVKSNDAYIKDETLSTELSIVLYDPASTAGKSESVNGELCLLSLEKSRG
jgi:isoleucyl-tRNA synthetase